MGWSHDASTLCHQHFTQKNWHTRKIFTKKTSSLSSSSSYDPCRWRSQSTFQKSTKNILKFYKSISSLWQNLQMVTSCTYSYSVLVSHSTYEWLQEKLAIQEEIILNWYRGIYRNKFSRLGINASLFTPNKLLFKKTSKVYQGGHSLIYEELNI